ncbi:alpha-galactosidase [Belliella sp. DSM 111904]|uniref:Alpha-galactosidase n=1 Tax=Belliella filtrata TaxID=2923435 RepID=A0ABS9V4Z6_9BACT|nr:alpha-galactosidase [Belliella filtrata]MCH7411492.1 alpha-galactosidase [Belliella filtrata]
MKPKNSYLLLLFFLLAKTSFGQDHLPQLLMHGDTLTISNVHASHTFLWDGNLQLLKIHLKKENFIHVVDKPIPDFFIQNQPFAFEKLSTKNSYQQDYEQENAYLKVELIAKSEALQVKYELKMYESSGAIQQTISFKGKPSSGSWENQKTEDNVMIESSQIGTGDETRFGYLPGFGQHASYEVIQFKEATDYHDQPVQKLMISPFRQAQKFQGNLIVVRSADKPYTLWALKQSPISWSQPNYPGFDFIVSNNGVNISGIGVESLGLNEEKWIQGYSFARSISKNGSYHEQRDWLTYQMQLRKYDNKRDAMILANTWGDRNKDGRMNETFILEELEMASQLGITHLQLDDGWQQGLSKNSASKAGLKWDDWTTEDWQPHQERFPNGFNNIVQSAKEKNIQLCLWFNPSKTDAYKNWERDADILLSYYVDYGIKVFKIDGLALGDQASQVNVYSLFEKVMRETGAEVTFNLDVTAGKRVGYHYMQEFGNIFLENRYTDWGNYYPYRTMRNLWNLSAYIPSSRLQIEWLNVYRNANKYEEVDVHSPLKVGLDYAYASTWAAQPLAWMELTGLLHGVSEVSNLSEVYSIAQKDWHHSVVLPLGSEPSGYAWSGFWMENKTKAYDHLLVYKEASDQEMYTFDLPNSYSNVKVEYGTSSTTLIDKDKLNVEMEGKYQFALIRLEK